jgi:Ni/Fe-hydrogenase 1 B-type cytochrome subunit
MVAVASAPESPAPHHDDQPALVPFYVWDRIVRATHWGIAGSMLLLAATGIYMGSPFLSAPGRASQHFLIGWAKVIHFYAAIVFTLSVLSRIVWMFLGPRCSGWRNFVPVCRRRFRDLWATTKFYLLIRPAPPLTIGHNPLAGLSYLGVFVLYLLMILTGFALYSVSSYSFMRSWGFLLPLFDGVQGARWLHHVAMWVLITFFIAHIFFASLTSRNEKCGTMDSIFSGYKFLPKGQPPDDE